MSAAQGQPTEAPLRGLNSTCAVGPAINATLSWALTDTLEVCLSVSGQNATNWIALGFSSLYGNAMSDSDIVLGYATALGNVVIASLYSNASQGFPIGPPLLDVSHTTFLQSNGYLQLCFQRDLLSGHNPILDDSTSYIIWAVGPTDATGPLVHGQVGRRAGHCPADSRGAHAVSLLGCPRSVRPHAGVAQRRNAGDQLGGGFVRTAVEGSKLALSIIIKENPPMRNTS